LPRARHFFRPEPTFYPLRFKPKIAISNEGLSVQARAPDTGDFGGALDSPEKI
jgi:hypothetical protein